MLPGVAVILLAPNLGLVAVAWFEELVAVVRDWRWWITVSGRRSLVPVVRASRASVVASAHEAVNATHRTEQ